MGRVDKVRARVRGDGGVRRLSIAGCEGAAVRAFGRRGLVWTFGGIGRLWAGSCASGGSLRGRGPMGLFLGVTKHYRFYL